MKYTGTARGDYRLVKLRIWANIVYFVFAIAAILYVSVETLELGTRERGATTADINVGAMLAITSMLAVLRKRHYNVDLAIGGLNIFAIIPLVWIGPHMGIRLWSIFVAVLIFTCGMFGPRHDADTDDMDDQFRAFIRSIRDMTILGTRALVSLASICAFLLAVGMVSTSSSGL